MPDGIFYMIVPSGLWWICTSI